MWCGRRAWRRRKYNIMALFQRQQRGAHLPTLIRSPRKRREQKKEGQAAILIGLVKMTNGGARVSWHHTGKPRAGHWSLVTLEGRDDRLLSLTFPFFPLSTPALLSSSSIWFSVSYSFSLSHILFYFVSGETYSTSFFHSFFFSRFLLSFLSFFCHIRHSTTALFLSFFLSVFLPFRLSLALLYFLFCKRWTTPSFHNFHCHF